MGAGAAQGLRSFRVVDEDLVMVLGDTLAAIEEGQACIAGRLAGFGPRAANRLEVVFEELVANVVRHGFAGAPAASIPRGSILVAVGPRPGAVQLTIEDDGRPFDPFSAPDPPPFESVETAQVGGLGVHVVRRFAASTRYDRAPASDLWSAFVERGARPVNRVTVTIATDA